jgi:Ca2+-binding RTX toxin-like protein
MITIDLSGATAGIDFEAYIRGGFLAGTTSGGFPVFDNNPMATSGEEIFVSYGSGSGDKYALIHGDFEYSMVTHQITGTAVSLELGVRGSGSFDGDGYFVGGSAIVSITGLDLGSSFVQSFIAAYMAGSGAEADDLNAFADALDAEPQHFIGSDYGDVYTGTALDDLIKGNGGDDTLAGGGGNDKIHGGDGVDTVIFTGNEADYVVKKYAGGMVTVSGGGATATVRESEKLQFADKTVAVVDIVEQARITIDATAMDGVDFDTYLVDYFAGVQTNGTSGYHGGTEDSFMGSPAGYLNGDQVSFKYRVTGDTTGAFTSVVIMEGEEIAYDSIHYGGYPHGSVSGTVDSLIFGTITGDEPSSGPGLYTGYTAQIVITGLGIHDDPGAGGSTSTNPVPTLYYGIRGGDAEKVAGVLAGYAQEFLGSAGDDVFTGGDFDDVIYGNLGNDVLRGGAGNDAIYGGKGDNFLIGGADDDQLFGASGRDTLYGEDGDDYLAGAKGRDILFGGAGADSFAFLKKADSKSKNKGWDIIRDFSQDEGDQIDLSAFKGKFDFIGKNGKFSGDSKELKYSYKKASTMVKIDSNADGKVDMKIKLNDKIALTEADFIL